MKTKKSIILFSILGLIQFLLFHSFIQREVAWNYIFHGDPTWYFYFNYKLFTAVVEREWNDVIEFANISPWGIMLFLETLIPQFLFGSSRFSVAVINLIYFIFTQIIVYVFFAKLTRSAIGGCVALLLLFAMQTPFRGDGPGLNIADFHFDLVLFFLLMILHVLVAWSNSFADKKISMLIGLVAGITVASRMVSFFLLSAVFGIFGIFLLYRRVRENIKHADLQHIWRERFINFRYASYIYILISILSIAVAHNALYSHYFRFIFDEKFIAERAGMYVMGTTSKMGEAYEILIRMIKFDFGEGYLVILFVLLALFCNKVVQSINTKKHIENQSNISLDSALLNNREALNTYWYFLLISCVTSYLIHLIFPIKSDHLTRMTAAPILIGFMLFLAPLLARNWHGNFLLSKFLSRTTVVFFAVTALIVQLNFYTGPGRYHYQKNDIYKLHNLYSDISKIISDQNLDTIAISVDRVKNFELGALLGFSNYEFEKTGRLIKHIPKLGGVIDESIERPEAFRLLESSNIALLGSLPYPQSRQPFMKSIRPFAKEIHSYVKKNFCLYKTYEVFGETKYLYENINVNKWQYKASESTEPYYSPSGLLEGTSHIWHAPWNENSTQWVEFNRKNPISITNLTMISQDGAPDRAPSDFYLESLDSEKGWVKLLSVKSADFFSKQTLSWPISVKNSSNKFKLVITKNNGNNTLMTIQNLKFEYLSPRNCAK